MLQRGFGTASWPSDQYQIQIHFEGRTRFFYSSAQKIFFIELFSPNRRNIKFQLIKKICPLLLQKFSLRLSVKMIIVKSFILFSSLTPADSDPFFTFFSLQNALTFEFIFVEHRNYCSKGEPGSFSNYLHHKVRDEQKLLL